MDKCRNIILKVLYPNIFLFILFCIMGFGGVITVFIFELQNNFFSYIAYVFSFYALIITVARSIVFIKWFNKKIYGNKYTNRLITDRKLKRSISLFFGTFFNMVYGIFKFITGYIYNSIWFGATGVYYLVLGLMKLSLVKYIVKKYDDKKQLIQYRNIGILMFLLNSTMVGMIILMIRDGEGAIYPGFMIYAQAAYTFYVLIVAIINVLKYKKKHSPVIAASKSINLVASVMSLFILQVAMINQFGENGSFKTIINVLTGTITSLVTIGIAIFMIINYKVKNKF